MPAFNKGELVWLLRKYLKIKRPNTKLDDKKLGPFKITRKVGTLARSLEIPATMKIHLIFHVSLLDPFQGNTKNPRINRPDPIKVDGEKEHKVKKILKARVGGRGKTKRRQYFVKWKRYPSSNNTWEDKENIKKAEALNVFLQKKKKSC